jgi:hypothetical protein
MMYKYDVQDMCVIHVVNDIYEHICYTRGQGTCKLATFHSIFHSIKKHKINLLLIILRYIKT